VKGEVPAASQAAPETEESGERPGGARPRFFLLVSLVTGTASFIYEIGWIRMLSLVLGTSTHAFELMLSAFILGLAFGGLWIQRRIDAVASPVRYLAWVQLIMGLLALSTLVLYGNTFEVMQGIVKTLPKTEAGYALFNLSSSGIAVAIMLPTTFCAGMTLPLITFTLLRRGYGERSIGAVYAANTVGAIIGVFFAIHLGMPLLGLKGLITFGAGLDIALGAVLFWSIAAEYPGRRVPLTAATVGALAIAVTLLFVHLDPYKMGSGVYRQGNLSTADTHRVLYHQDGKTATVSCFLSKAGVLSIRTNGKPDAAITTVPGKEAQPDEYTMVLLGAIPMLFHPGAQTAAAIGLGSGMTSHTLLSNPAIRQVDTVEIEKAMIEGANSFRPRVELVYTDPRSRIYNDDAKTFFSTYNRKYDIIVSEPSNPWVSGVAGLFSGEFYRHIQRHLHDDGLFVQWIQLYEISEDLVVSVLKAVSASFSDFAVYATNGGDMVIIAVKNGRLHEPDYALLNVPGINEAMRRIHIKTEQDIAIRRMGSKQFLGTFLASSPIRANSDYYPVLDQNAARARFLEESARELVGFSHIPVPTLEMLDPSSVRREVTNVTPSPFLETAQETSAAMGLRDYFRTGNFGSQNMRDDLKQHAILLRNVCRGTTSIDPGELLGSVFTMSVAMIPYLGPAELDSFWKTLGSGACSPRRSSLEQQWYDLFKTVGRRDAAGMYERARSILAGGHDLIPPERKYLLAAGMVGALAQGERAAARELWIRYRTTAFGKDRPDLLFRLLAAGGGER
jgi:spermidine synthase